MKNFWKDKKVLSTGASGFIGSHTIERLLEEDAIITAAVSPATSIKKTKQSLPYKSKKLTIKKVDLLRFDQCLLITKGQNIVLNFAALDGGAYFKMQYPAKIFHANSLITLNMLEASNRNNIQRFLLTSSIEVYPGNLPSRVTEKYGFRENLDEKTEGYAWSKRLAEIAAKMYYKEHGLQTAIARLGNVYGPRDVAGIEKNRVIPTFINNSLQGKDIIITGGGLQERSFLYISDLVEGLLSLIEKYAVADPVNIASQEYITVKQLAQLVIALTKKNNKVNFEKGDIIFFRKRRISINKARKVIGFKEKYSLQAGLEKTIDYFKENL